MAPVLLNPSRFGGVSSSYTAAVLADSPLAYWRLGDTSGTTMVDSSGNGHNGTYVNSPTLNVAGATSDGDKAVSFASASSQQGSVAYASWMSIPSSSSSNMTIEAWVKNNGGVSQIIAGRGSATTVGYIGIAAGGQAFMQSRVGSTSPAVTGTTLINNNAWHHVVGVRAGTSLLIYVDGVLEATNTSGGTINADTTNGFYVASRNGSAYFNGVVDEVAYYSTALSSTRIAAHFAAA